MGRLKSQIKETLEKLTNKENPNQRNIERRKELFAESKDELQQELESQDKTLKVT